MTERGKGHRVLKGLLIIVGVLGALYCLWFATTPWRFSVGKTLQLREDVKTFLRETENSREMNGGREIPYQELRELLEQYNEDIFLNEQADLSSSQAYSNFQIDFREYGLNSDAFAVLTIPKIDLEMPVYIGASNGNLANGAAVLSQTSVPIGGINTNSVISGHRGWNGYKYFMDVPKLEMGDSVFITNPWETLEYRVFEIKIVEPGDIKSILIRPGQDILTLLTCHPPSSGGQFRFLVFCERVDPAAESAS